MGKEDNPAQSTFLLTSPDAEKWLLESPKYRYQESDYPESGMSVPFGKEREQAVKVNRIIKGRLQDCWELYTSENAGTPFKTFQNESRHSSTCSHNARLKTIIK